MLPLLVAAVGLQFVVAGPQAPPRVFLDPAAGRVLEPGTTVSVVWNDVPREVPECEILLLVGGDTTLRVTEELSPGSGSYRWVVPNVSASDARLILRMNRNGREVESAPSAPFSIRRSPEAAPASLQVREQEVWLVEDLGEAPEPSASLPTSLGIPRGRVALPHEDNDPWVPPEGDGGNESSDGARIPLRSTPAPRRAPLEAGANSPRSFPQRI